jgi:hypothetical protein
LLVENDCLAVENGATDAQAARGSLDRWETMRPIMPAARQDADVPLIEVNRDPIAIPFDFINPIGADRRSLFQDSKTRLYAGRHGIERQPGLRWIAGFSRPAANRLFVCGEKLGTRGLCHAADYIREFLKRQLTRSTNAETARLTRPGRFRFQLRALLLCDLGAVLFLIFGDCFACLDDLLNRRVADHLQASRPQVGIEGRQGEGVVRLKDKRGGFGRRLCSCHYRSPFRT